MTSGRDSIPSGRRTAARPALDETLARIRSAADEAFDQNPGSDRLPPAMAARWRRLLAPPAQQEPQPATAA